MSCLQRLPPYRCSLPPLRDLRRCCAGRSADYAVHSFEVDSAAALAACACAACITGALCEAGCAALFPATFRFMRRWHAERRPEAVAELNRAAEQLDAALPSALDGHTATVQRRVKSARSAFEKVALRSKGLDDLLALRVVIEPKSSEQAAEAECVQRCREVQTLVQSLWPGGLLSVKDYVSSPKEKCSRVAAKLAGLRLSDRARGWCDLHRS